MANSSKSSKLLVFFIAWAVILGVGIGVWKFGWPMVSSWMSDRQMAETGSESQYQNEAKIAADAFDGYDPFRAPVFQNQLKKQGTKVTIVDDGADYGKRIQALKSGKVPMAVFTIDSLITACEDLGEYPGTIIFVIDESKGADAIMAYKDGVGSIQDLDDPDARFVLTENSPSHFFGRIAVAQFSLPSLPVKWVDGADGSAGVFSKFKSADRSAKRAYIMWEPDVSKAKKIEGAHVLLDSSKISGYIIDVFVVQRQFLQDEPDLVRQVCEAYFRSYYSINQKQDGWHDLVLDNAKKAGDSIGRDQAEAIVAGSTGGCCREP